MSFDKKTGGLRRMKRLAVHMTSTMESVQLKNNANETVSIQVDIGAAQKAGIQFWATTDKLDDPACSILCLQDIPVKFVPVVNN